MKIRQEYGFIETNRCVVTHIYQDKSANYVKVGLLGGELGQFCLYDNAAPEVYTNTIELREYVEDPETLQSWYTAYKCQLSCVDCGASERDVILQFHHLEPENKSYNIYNMLSGLFTRQEILEEIGKCVPVCWNCHKLRTAAENKKLVYRQKSRKPNRIAMYRPFHAISGVPVDKHKGTGPHIRGHILKAIRKSKGLSLKDTAEKAGISAGYLSNIENGLRSCSFLQILDLLAKAYGYELHIKLVGKDKPLGCWVEYELWDSGTCK